MLGKRYHYSALLKEKHKIKKSFNPVLIDRMIYDDKSKKKIKMMIEHQKRNQKKASFIALLIVLLIGLLFYKILN